ncbi:hypothetical protein E8F20_11575 [Pseudomonas sp. BN415]|uniref:hypothetical protein n=1 Tax=Pseudomonas sp. BN415 TaxID=2567889 RepID=UPI0024569BA4|nr:hypothetical protein [Pseudomonas sp. BN415]MDH4582506.1 hypothetical protein [Pseudomonas sp. BN415]
MPTIDRKVSLDEKYTILLYCLVALLVGGGVGVYFPLIMDRPISSESLATYAIATLAPFAADIFLPENYWKSMTRFQRMRVCALCALGALFSIVALFRNEKSYAMVWAVAGTLIVLYLSYRICILSGRFQPEVPPVTEDGGAAPEVDKLSGGGLV